MRSSTVLPGLSLLSLSFACAPAPIPRAPPPPAVAPSPPPAPVSAAGPAPESLSLLLRPVREPEPLVHVALDLVSPPGDATIWRLAAGAPDRVRRPLAHDAAGPVPVHVSALAGGALALVLERPPRERVHLEYDVLAGTYALDDPLGVMVHGDRFRGAGEALVALPESIEGDLVPVSLAIDRGPIEAEKAASSLGVGPERRTKLRPRALRYAAYVAGAQGDVVLDSLEGHDEGAWIGYPSFDLRGTLVELAEERSALANILGAHDVLPDVPWTSLFEVSGSRPAGAFTVTPRFDGVLVQIGTTQPWNPSLRLALAQLLARRWIGDAIRFTPAGHPPELGWFDDGVARYLAIKLLARVEVLAPKDWAEMIAQELSVVATSPYATQANAAVAARADDDPAARLLLMMRGALYAARESAVLRERTKGAKTLEAVLVGLLAQARSAHDGTIAPLPPAAWLEQIAREDPDARAAFESIVVRGGPIALPPGALGPCFRAGTGTYVAFDAGFDLEGTRRERDGKVVALRAEGPAARAGLRADDLVQSIEASEGDASVPVRVTVSRGGATDAVTYAPRGAQGRGQTWSRVPGVPDEKCGLPP